MLSKQKKRVKKALLQKADRAGCVRRERNYNEHIREGALPDMFLTAFKQ